MEELLEVYFEEAEIEYSKEYDDGDPIYTTQFELKDGDFWACIIDSKEFQTVVLYIKSPVNVPEPNRSDVAEYIARANFHNYEGLLMLDFDDGSLFYKYSMRYDPDADIQHIKYQLNVSLRMGIEEMETHFPGILSVIYNDVTPAEALTKAEYGSNAKLN